MIEYVPVETIVEKIVEKPVEVIKIVNKTVEVEKITYVDRPVEVEKTIYIDNPITVEKIVYKEPDCGLKQAFGVEVEGTTSSHQKSPEEPEEVVRTSKSIRNKQNTDDFTHSLYDDSAWDIDYDYAFANHDYTQFDTYLYDDINYYYDNYHNDDFVKYYNENYYYYAKKSEPAKKKEKATYILDVFWSWFDWII